MHGIDFFDVDHTIVDGATGLFSVVVGIRSGVLPLRVVLSIPSWYRLYFQGMKGAEDAERSLWQFAGFERTQVEQLGQSTFEMMVRPRIFPGARRRIEELHAAGRRAVFVTSSFHHLVRPLAEELRVDHIIANELLFEGSKTTGQLRKPFLFGPEKLRQALAYAHASGTDPAACSFHTDSVHDLPLMERVGHPVAVNPDWRLRRIARERQWEIVEFAR